MCSLYSSYLNEKLKDFVGCIIIFPLLMIEELVMDHIYFCWNNKVKAVQRLFRLYDVVEEGLRFMSLSSSCDSFINCMTWLN